MERNAHSFLSTPGCLDLLLYIFCDSLLFNNRLNLFVTCLSLVVLAYLLMASVQSTHSYLLWLGKLGGGTSSEEL
jgi:hypothetical protein